MSGEVMGVKVHKTQYNTFYINDENIRRGDIGLQQPTVDNLNAPSL